MPSVESSWIVLIDWACLLARFGVEPLGRMDEGSLCSIIEVVYNKFKFENLK